MLDVAIVGAGPAGARAAFVLARRGARVAIFDPSHPREKPCGGGVTGRALALVGDSLDVGAFPRTVVRTARFAPDAIVDLDGAALVVASRAAFDRALLDAAIAAGAGFVPARVSALSLDHDRVTIDTTAGRFTAAFVVGADGANSLVRRRVAAPWRRDQLSIATGFFAHGVSSTEIAIDFVSRPPGYLWSFPRPDHLAVGICAQADAGIGPATLRARAAAWIEATRLAGGARLQAYAWPIPSLSASDFDTLPLSGPRWALAGDAAGLVDPITREGIFFALASGESIAEALTGGNPSAAYASRVHDEAVAELRRAAHLRAGFFRPAFVTLLLEALRRSAAVRSVMADLVAGRQTYAQLKWRLIKTLEIGLIWRALTT